MINCLNEANLTENNQISINESLKANISFFCSNDDIIIIEKKESERSSQTERYED